jgi:hypothetical protein
MPTTGQRFCVMPFSSIAGSDADHEVERRHNVDDMYELVAQSALTLTVALWWIPKRS